MNSKELSQTKARARIKADEFLKKNTYAQIALRGLKEREIGFLRYVFISGFIEGSEQEREDV